MSNKTRDAFRAQRKHATKRGISFLFTYVAWVKWWQQHLGPNWFELRGLGGDKYCMARKDDKGPYKEGNVKCLTNIENRREQVAPIIGERNPNAKLTKQQVSLIRQSNQPRKILAKIFDVNVTTICRVQNQNIWK